jgi:hypothetical protein
MLASSDEASLLDDSTAGPVASSEPASVNGSSMGAGVGGSVAGAELELGLDTPTAAEHAACAKKIEPTQS